VIGAVDPSGDAWATLRSGYPGFLSVPDEHTLRVRARRDPADPADQGLNDGDAVGLLGIEMHTRRRNRMNGVIGRIENGAFDVAVSQSYGNCPQYIQRRELSFARDPDEPFDGVIARAEYLDERAKKLIARSDTFFVASYVDLGDSNRQVDVSHRGGKCGFVRIGSDGALTIPDFAGNLFFNTLGNISMNPKCGLLFIEFASGDLLQLSGDGEVILNSPEIAAFQGAERLWRFKPRLVVYREAASAVRWKSDEDGRSPNAVMTGNWDEAAARLRAAELATVWRHFRIKEIVQESRSIRSLYLEPADGAGIVPHKAGQHLSIRVTPEGTHESLIRSYTLSVAPSDSCYRISVKLAGLVSTLLHGLKPGDVIEAKAPAGSFTIDAREGRPAVLLSAGIGITPMLAMLRHVIYEGARTRRTRLLWLFDAFHSKADRAFDHEITSLVEASGGAVKRVRILGDTNDAAEGRDYNAGGRIGIDLLKSTLPFDDYEFYLCGPGAFMQSIYDALTDLQVPNTRIYTEAFGPAILKRRRDRESPVSLSLAAATSPKTVRFVKSEREASWTPESGTLLELAESSGLAPPFSCRSGNCGTCRTRIVFGSVVYESIPAFAVPRGEALICCAKPAQGSDVLQLDT
jgi:uncharacterized protein